MQKENTRGVKLFKALAKLAIFWAIAKDKTFHYDGPTLTLKIPEYFTLMHVYGDALPWVQVHHDGFIRWRAMHTAAIPPLEKGGFLFLRNKSAFSAFLRNIDNSDF